MRPRSSISFSFVTLLVTIQIYLIINLVTCQESKRTTRVLVNLEYLPEPFSNDKLQNYQRKLNTCFELLGCIERLPNAPSPKEPGEMKTEFKIFTKNHEQYIPYAPIENCLQDSSECTSYSYNLSSLVNSNYNPNLRTIILIGGYMSGAFEKWQMEIKNIWFNLEDINLIMVAWTGGNKGLYQFAVANTKIVSRQITVLLYYLAKLNNLELSDESFSEKLYLIGHSLGAHISGFVGQDFGGKVGRITGLDTAGPNFVNYNETYRLDSSDAQFVDAIHTNGGNLTLGQAYYGMEMPVGHVDYYANDGKHQPNCKFNSFGCSHKAASELFISFLKHEQYMREHFDMIKLDYHDYHRIFAYKSDNYERFHNGSSLSQFCPITTLGDDDLYSEDIRQCSLPIDFISWFDKLRNELEQKYQINFDPSVKKSNKFFFYTSAEVPYLNHHNLIRVRVTKSDNLMKNSSAISAGCDISLDIKMANGMGLKHEIKQYNLIDEGDHYEIIVPYLSPNKYSKYALATLDANDFYTDQMDNLLENVAKVFPTSISINGLLAGSTKPKGKGFFETLKNFFGVAKGQSKDGDAGGKIRVHQCSLNIESVSVQPMKKLHRHFVAIYSAKGSENSRPDVTFLFNPNSTLPKKQILPKGDENLLNDVSQRMVSEIFIDTVIVGPIDESEATKVVEDEEEPPSNFQDSNGVGEAHNTKTSHVSSSTWLKLTIATVALTLVVMAIMLRKFIPFRRSSAEDKSALIV